MNNRRGALWVVAWLVGLFLFLLPFAPRSFNVTVSDPEAISSDSGAFRRVIRGRVLVSPLLPRAITLAADDCFDQVVVDGTTVYTVPACQACLHCRPMSIALPRTMKTGLVPYSYVVTNLSGQSWAQMGARPQRWLFAYLLAAAAGLLLVRKYVLGSLRKRALTVGLLALAASTHYFLLTHATQRQYDFWGHIEYVTELGRRHFPAPQHGWQTYHPPLYYLVGIANAAFRAPEDSTEGLYQLQRVAIVAFVATILVAVFAWGRRREFENVHWIGLVAFAILPGHLFFAARSNNDVPLPLLGTVSFLLALEYTKRPRRSLAVLGGLVSLAAVMSKYAALPLWGAFAAWVAVTQPELDAVPRPFRERAKDTLAAFVPGLVGILAWTAWTFHNTGHFIYSNVGGLTADLRVPNDARRYLTFDLLAFLSEPSAATRVGNVRLSMPTFFLTTLVQGGESTFPAMVELLTFLRASFLVLTVAVVAGLWRIRSSADKVLRLAACYVAFHVPFYLYLNYRQPFSCTQDARYAATAFFAGALLLSKGAAAALEHSQAPIRGITRAGIWSFSALLALFYVILFFFGGNALAT